MKPAHRGRSAERSRSRPGEFGSTAVGDRPGWRGWLSRSRCSPYGGRAGSPSSTAPPASWGSGAAVEPTGAGRRRCSGRNDEAHISAQCSQEAHQARLQGPHADSGRPGRSAVTPPPGPGSAGRLMIEGLSGRRAFDRIRADGVSARRGPIRMTHCPGPGRVCRFGFGMPKSSGSAVVRNRSRRRVQAVLRDLDREAGGLPRPGDYLVQVAAPLDRLSHQELRVAVVDLLRRVGRSAAR